MKALIRLTLVVAPAFLLTACLFGLRFVCDPAGLRTLIEEDRRCEQLQQIQRDQCHYNESRERLVRELIASQCSLSEAIARWEKLDSDRLQQGVRQRTHSTVAISQFESARADPDCYYRVISRRVATFLRDRPEAKASVLRRLEKENQQFRASR